MLHRTVQLYRDSFSGLRREVWYLSLVLLINRTGAMVIPFLTIYLTSQKGFSLIDAGLIVGSFGFGSAAGSYIGGWITDRFGFYQVQQLTLIGSGLMFWVLGHQEGFWPISIGIFFLSLVTDAFRPANQAALAFYSNPANRARAYGLLRLAVNLGFSMGPIIGGALIAGLGYEYLFVVNGWSCIFAAIAFRLLLPPGRLVTEEAAETENLHGPSAYANRSFLAFVFFLMLGAIAFMQFFGTLPVYLKDHLGYSELEVGLLITINGLLIVAVEMPIMHITGKHFKPLPLITVGYLLLAVGYLLLQGAAVAVLFSVGFIILITFGEMLSMPFSSTYTADIAPVSRRGQYMGLLSMSWAGAFIIAPSLGMYWAQTFGFTALWWFVAILALVAAGGIWAVHSYEERKKLQQLLLNTEG